MKMVRRDMVFGAVRATFNVGLDGVFAECICRHVRGTANRHVWVGNATRRVEENARVAALAADLEDMFVFAVG